MKLTTYYFLLVLCFGLAPQLQAQQKLNAKLVTDGDVGIGDYRTTDNYILSRDEKTVIYLADQDTDNFYELYTVSVDGSTNPIKISDPQSKGNVRRNFVLHPTEEKVFYLSGDYSAPNWEPVHLYVSPLDGTSSPVQLTTQSSSSSGISEFYLTKDGERIIYLSNQNGGLYEIYSMLVNNPNSVSKISHTLAQDDLIQTTRLSDNGKMLVYRIKHKLYAVPTDGSTTAIQLNTDIGGQSIINFNITLSADGLTVYFRAKESSNDVSKLYSTPTNASSPPTKINHNLTSSERVGNFELSKDGKKLVYLAGSGSATSNELYSVDLTNANSITKLTLTTNATLYFSVYFRINNDASKVITHATLDPNATVATDLYAISFDEGSFKKLNNSTNTDPVGVFKLSEDRKKVFFTTQKLGSSHELYQAFIEEEISSTKINGDLVQGGHVQQDFVSSYDGNTLVYRADQDTDDDFELYSLLNLTPPSNDETTGAINLAASATCSQTLGTNLAATNSQITNPTIPVPTCGDYQGGDIWFSTFVPASRDLSINLVSVLGGINDVSMAIYTQDGASFVLEECINGSGTMPSLTSTRFETGTQLFIRVWENGNDAVGEFAICVLDNNPENEVDAPAELTGKAISSSEIDLFWTDNSINEVNFKLYRDGVEIAVLEPNTTTFSDTGLEANTFYTYQVTAFSTNQSASTNTLSIATLPLQPTIVEIISACQDGVAYIELGNAPQNGFYRWYASDEVDAQVLGEVTDAYFKTPILTQDTTFYAVVVVDDRESSPRIPVFLSVGEPIDIQILQGDEIFSCTNEAEIEAVGDTGLTYQWKYEGELLNETNSKLIATQSGKYQLLVNRNSCTEVLDFEVHLNLTPLARIEQNDTVSFCNNGNLTVLDPVSTSKYQWLKEGVIIGSGTTLHVSESGTYVLKARQYDCVDSMNILVNIVEIPENQVIESVDTKFCPNDFLT